jgi:hypothetical protein
MELWWNDTDRGKLKYWEINLSLCHSVTYKSTAVTLGSKTYVRVNNQMKNRLTYNPAYLQNSPAAPVWTALSSEPAVSGLWRQDSG